jgi:hypothetical protein
MSFNYGRSLLMSLIENHIAIIIACAPSTKSILGSTALPIIRNSYYNNKRRLSTTWSSPIGSSHSDSPTSHNQTPGNQTPQHGRSFSKNGISSTRSSSTISFGKALHLASMTPPNATYSRSNKVTLDSMDIERGNHERQSESAWNRMTRIFRRSGSSRRPHSCQSNIYITHDITVETEAVVDVSWMAGEDRYEKEFDFKNVLATEDKRLSLSLSVVEVDGV